MSAVLEAREPSARYLEAVTPTLVRQFELLATASGGVARLRELILTLAIRGSLVPRNSTETVRVTGATVDDVGPFELPEGWLWITLGALKPKFQNGASSRGDPGGQPITVLRLADIKDRRVSLADTREVPIRRQDIQKYLLEDGDILITRVNGSADIVGQFNLVEGETHAIYCDHFIRMRVSRAVLDPKYLALFGSSVVIRSRISNLFVSTAGQKTVNQGHIASLPIAIPPLPEQARIVARVDELMRLCDALEAQGRLEAEQHARLLGTLLGTLTDSSTPEELAANWQRVAEHFDLLLDRPEAVDALEQTLLQLAVRGLLVPQDSNQEPGVKNSHRSLTTAEEPIGEAELPFDVPANWRWVRLGSQAELINGDRGKNYPNRAEYVVTGVPFINTGHIEPDGTLSQDSMHHLTRAKFESLRSGKTRSGDLVYCLRGATLGKTAIVEYPEGAIASSLVILRFKESVNRKFAYLFLTSPFGRELIRRFDNGSAQPNLAASSVARYVMPLPPLEEQSRIVARAAELRRLCADLRQRLAASQATQSHLAEALVDMAVA